MPNLPNPIQQQPSSFTSIINIKRKIMSMGKDSSRLIVIDDDSDDDNSEQSNIQVEPTTDHAINSTATNANNEAVDKRRPISSTITAITAATDYNGGATDV
ncbi:hypothetical protein BGZ47_011169 [Haplosporangium gracile]|nr:hypothetical protein BGZ47_011169 [Haplosporangium gracile]